MALEVSVLRMSVVYAEGHLSFAMLNATMLSVIMPSIASPVFKLA
jgi:hypothetical protein